MATNDLPVYIRKLDSTDEVTLGVDSLRIIEVVEHALVVIDELLESPDFMGSVEKLKKDLSAVLSTRMVATTKLTLSLRNKALPDLVLVLDMRRKTVAVTSKNIKKRAMINNVLRTIR